MKHQFAINSFTTDVSLVSKGLPVLVPSAVIVRHEGPICTVADVYLAYGKDGKATNSLSTVCIVVV